MTDVLIVGGGVVGMGLGMILANDGHAVTMLERDAAPAPSGPDDAWDSWDRQGVTQFRLSHLFLSRYRHILEAELPDVAAAIERDGGLRFNPMDGIPESFSGGFREGDERFELLSGRRAVVERAVASVAEEARGLHLRRGVAVRELLSGPAAVDGIPHVTGVRTAEGEELRSDLVIDCSGRRSALPSWLEALGARPPADEVEDSGFIYLARHFRSRDGQLPFALGPLLQSYGSISVLTLPADNATWSVTLIARSGDRALLGLKDVARWEEAVRSLPTVAHWIDGDPIEDRIITMAKIEDRIRDLRPGGVPVATGILAVADAWACTNPSVGRGASIGMLHAQTLRDTLRHTGPDRPGELSEAFAVATADTVQPWYEATLAFDRHRLAEMAAEAEGVTYQPDDPAYEITGALAAASGRDPDVLRGFLDIVGVLDLPQVVMARPGLFEKVIAFGADWRTKKAIGPNRDQLVAMASG
jgi:2-polyprenyl-6-methoxyphenol hydroxylase-like FAD-dependent oxidoreductase